MAAAVPRARVWRAVLPVGTAVQEYPYAIRFVRIVFCFEKGMEGKLLTGHEELGIRVNVPIHLDSLSGLESVDVRHEALVLWGISSDGTLSRKRD